MEIRTVVKVMDNAVVLGEFTEMVGLRSIADFSQMRSIPNRKCLLGFISFAR